MPSTQFILSFVYIEFTECKCTFTNVITALSPGVAAKFLSKFNV